MRRRPTYRELVLAVEALEQLVVDEYPRYPLSHIAHIWGHRLSPEHYAALDEVENALFRRSETSDGGSHDAL